MNAVSSEARPRCRKRRFLDRTRVARVRSTRRLSPIPRADIYLSLHPSASDASAGRRLPVDRRPIFQICDGVFGKKFRRDALVRYLPGRGLGTVLAKFKNAGISRLGPGTADAHETVSLVLLEQNARS